MAVDHLAPAQSPLVSIIIPAFNSGQFLERAIRSVHSQTFTDWELVVINDGSVDDTASICAAFSRIIFLQQKRCGPSIARNAGILASTGKLIAFLDHDDEWQPTKLEKQIAALDLDCNIALCHTDVACIDGAGALLDSCAPLASQDQVVIHSINEAVQKSYNSSGILTCSSVLLKRSALASSGLFDPDLPICGDTDLWLKISLHHKIIFLPEKLTLYRLHENNESKNASGLAELRRLKRRYQTFAGHTGRQQPVELINKLISEAPRHQAAQDFDRCRRSLRNGDVCAFVVQLLAAVKGDACFVWHSCLLWLNKSIRPGCRKAAGVREPD